MSFGKTNYRMGGTRGGADQFKWEDVKNDKYRENYLGHSVQAPVGRWQKGKDLTWYAKASKAQKAEALQAELAMAKQRDEDMMNEALGIAPKRRHEPVEGLSQSEMKELLRRGDSERDNMDAERIEGLGAAPVEAEGFETGPKKTLAERYKDQLASGKADTTYALPGTITSQMTESEAKAARKEARKAEKAAKKLKKKEKKERRRAKRHHTHDSDEEDDQPRRRHRRRDEEDMQSRGRSRSHSPRHSERYRDSSRRSRSADQRRSRSRSPIERPSSRRESRSPDKARGRSRSPDSQYRRHRHRSPSPSPVRRWRSRSRSRSRRR